MCQNQANRVSKLSTRYKIWEYFFFILHWRWDSIQFDCTISSLIHIWREYRVLICWQFFPNFLHWWNMHPRIVFVMHKVSNGRKCHWINVQFAPFSILFIEKLYWRSTPGYNGPLKLCPLALWKLSLGNEGRVEAGGQVTQNAQYRFQLKCEFKIQSFQFNARALSTSTTSHLLKIEYSVESIWFNIIQS